MGIGMMLPIIATIRTSHSGRPRSIPMATGMAPRSSINGTIEISKTNNIFQTIRLLYHFLAVFDGHSV